jgi:Tfp pilus assembly protein FimT
MQKDTMTLMKLVVGVAIAATAIAIAQTGFETILTEQIRKAMN